MHIFLVLFGCVMASPLSAMTSEIIERVLLSNKMPKLYVDFSPHEIAQESQRHQGHLSFEEAFTKALINLKTQDNDEDCLVCAVAEDFDNKDVAKKVQEILNNNQTSIGLLTPTSGLKLISQQVMADNWVFYLDVDGEYLDFNFIAVVNEKRSYNYFIKKHAG